MSARNGPLFVDDDGRSTSVTIGCKGATGCGKPLPDYSGLPSRFHPGNVALNPPRMFSFTPYIGSAAVRGQNLDPVTQRSKDGSLSRDELTDIGNYNFGVAGAARGYDVNTLLRTGDGLQWGFGKQGCVFCIPKDRARDSEMIRQGFNDFGQNGGSR